MSPLGDHRAAPSAPLVGRATEWKRIADAVELVRGGSFRSLFVHGEAGIGKTRLIRELVAHAEQLSFSVFLGRAEDLERMRPFSAIADGIANLARTRGRAGTDFDDLLKQLSSSPNTVASQPGDAPGPES